MIKTPPYSYELSVISCPDPSQPAIASQFVIEQTDSVPLPEVFEHTENFPWSVFKVSSVSKKLMT